MVTFLAWAAEPNMEERKRTGAKVVMFLMVMTGVLYARQAPSLGRRALTAERLKRRDSSCEPFAAEAISEPLHRRIASPLRIARGSQ